MSVTALTKETFESEVLKASKPVLVDFWASWCGPCKMLSPMIDQVAEELSDVKVCKINIDDQPELAQKFGVMSIPTLLVFENGKVTKTSVGLIPKPRILELLGK